MLKTKRQKEKERESHSSFCYSPSLLISEPKGVSVGKWYTYHEVNKNGRVDLYSVSTVLVRPTYICMIRDVQILVTTCKLSSPMFVLRTVKMDGKMHPGNLNFDFFSLSGATLNKLKQS